MRIAYRLSALLLATASLVAACNSDEAPADGTGNTPIGGAGENNCPPADPTFRFDTDIQADIDALGCSGASCHGDGVAGFKLFKNPKGNTDLRANYQAMKLRAEGEENSELLLKPTGNLNHGGGKRFARGDETYDRWLTWIKECYPR